MRHLTFFLTLFLAASTLSAQDTEPESWHVFLNGNFQLGFPQEDFKQNLDDVGVGGGGLLLFQIGKLPIYGGAEFSGMSYDTETRDYIVNVGGFQKEYELRTRNSIFMMHGVLRVQPKMNSPIRPYIDGMLGTKNLYTRTRLTEEDDNNDPDDNSTDSRVDEGDWAFSYGAALGLQINLSRTGGILLDLRCAYLPGDNASYLVRKPGDNINYEEPIDAFEKKSSPTTLLMPQIGLTFKLSDFSDSGDY